MMMNIVMQLQKQNNEYVFGLIFILWFSSYSFCCSSLCLVVVVEWVTAEDIVYRSQPNHTFKCKLFIWKQIETCFERQTQGVLPACFQSACRCICTMHGWKSASSWEQWTAVLLLQKSDTETLILTAGLFYTHHINQYLLYSGFSLTVLSKGSF